MLARATKKTEKARKRADTEESSNEEAPNTDDHLHGFSTDEDDSSDEEEVMDEESHAVDIEKLPTIAKDDAAVKQKLERAKRQPVMLSAS